ncbi:MAG: LuxR C-terminal-related transcriptional regulator [Acidimicrobiia bacterium]
MTSVRSGTATPQLLATKLHTPQRRREVIDRPRLTGVLLHADAPPMTLVSAPAGFGKTTLLSASLATPGHYGGSVAWLSLDGGDNAPALFGGYVVAAVRRVAPEIGVAAEAMLRSSEPLRSVLTALINDIVVSGIDLVIVLDDYHVIDSAEVHEAVEFLVDHAPAHLQLMLATRSDPPLPLARWRARCVLREIRAADLRFSTAEAATYLNTSMGLALEGDDVRSLGARTEGWIAALQLAAISMRGRDDISGFIDTFTGDDRFVVDYLAQEVLDRQSTATRDFLMMTSVLDRFTGALCDTVTGTTGGKRTLEWLDRANLFVVALDDRRHWYRYHHLFADVLRARLLDEQPELVGELHRRASDWFDRHGDSGAAIEHALAGGAFERAAALIEMAAPALRRTRQESMLRRWLESLPEPLFDARPVLTLSLVGARMASNDTRGVAELLDVADRWLDEPGDATGWIDTADMADAGAPIVFDHDEFVRLPAQVAVLRAGMALLAGDLAATVVHARRARALAGPNDHMPHGAAAALLGLAHWSRGELADARQRYTEAVSRFVTAEHISDVLGCSLALADIQIAQGRLSDAASTYESALHHAASSSTLRGTADMHVGLAELHLITDELDDAARHLAISSELGERAGLPQNRYRWLVASALLHQARQQRAQALVELAEAERCFNSDFSPSIRPVPAVLARLQLADGDLASAMQWMAARDLGPADELSYVHEYEHITVARVMLAMSMAGENESLDEVTGLLDRLLESALSGGRLGAVIEVKVLQAVAHMARDERHAATVSLEQALRCAEPEGHVLVFVEAGDALQPLLHAASFADGAARHADRVLEALARTLDPSAVAVDATGNGAGPTMNRRMVDPLSGRELDALRLLRSDLSGPDIARELHVSLNTVRSHTKSIYSKLGATNRREAIRLARECGL